MRVTRSCEVIKGMLTRASPEKRLRSLMLRVWTVAVVVIGSCLGYRRALHHLALRSKHMQPAPSLTSRVGPSGLGHELSIHHPGQNGNPATAYPSTADLLLAPHSAHPMCQFLP